jgi:chromosome partitioning protein
MSGLMGELHPALKSARWPIAAQRAPRPRPSGAYKYANSSIPAPDSRELREDRPNGRYVLRNAFDSRTKQTNECIDRQLESVRDLLLDTVIRKSEAINQAQISGEPIFTFDPNGHGAQDFEALTQEILHHA